MTCETQGHTHMSVNAARTTGTAEAHILTDIDIHNIYSAVISVPATMHETTKTPVNHPPEPIDTRLSLQGPSERVWSSSASSASSLAGSWKLMCGIVTHAKITVAYTSALIIPVRSPMTTETGTRTYSF